eukprot:CFRG3105T1
MGQVLYVCGCGLKLPLTHVYYCSKCLAIKCSDCTTEGFEKFYCRNCLSLSTSLSKIELKSLKNRCKKCTLCPICASDLTIRTQGNVDTKSISPAVHELQGTPESAQIVRYYYACGACYWSSLEVGVEAEKEEHLRALLLAKEKSMDGAVDSFQHMADHFGQLARPSDSKQLSDIQKRASFADKHKLPPGVKALLSSTSFMANRIGSVRDGHDKPEEDLPTTYVQEGDFDSELQQVLMLGEGELELRTTEDKYRSLCCYGTDSVMPTRTPLCARINKRCRDCDMMLIRPDKHPGMSAFQLKLTGYSNVPHVDVIAPATNAHANKNTQHIEISNPLIKAITVMLSATSLTQPECLVIGLPTHAISLTPKDDLATLLNQQSGANVNPTHKMNLYLIPPTPNDVIVLRMDYMIDGQAVTIQTYIDFSKPIVDSYLQAQEK